MNEKAFACHICVNKYTSKAGLDVHIKSHLPSDKPRPEPVLMCDICGKLFYRKYSLEKHHMSHTGDKPYECEQCGTRFKERYIIKLHWDDVTNFSYSGVKTTFPHSFECGKVSEIYIKKNNNCIIN